MPQTGRRGGGGVKTFTSLRPKRLTGVIKTIFSPKGYGFIDVDETAEYWFHREALMKGQVFEDYSAGDVVTFIPTMGKEGKKRAVGVRRV